MKVLLTGGSGFIGQALLARLTETCEVRAAIRRGRSNLLAGVEPVFTGEIDGGTDWSDALRGVDVVVHLAGRAHVLSEKTVDPLIEFRRVNVEGTAQLAFQAAEAGISRFIFISSIGVNGGSSLQPFTEADSPCPIEPYAVSKLEAERCLMSAAETSGMEWVVIRPPLVYGPGAPGNFQRLVQATKKGIPLPLGAVNNRRTLIARDNLVDLIALCVKHPAAANEIFLAGDAEDLSTTELLQLLARVLGRPSRLIPVPVWLMEWGAAIFGRRMVIRKICGDLQVDTSKVRRLLNWNPPVTVDDGLAQVARHELTL